jgi:hypothetical protein
VLGLFLMIATAVAGRVLWALCFATAAALFVDTLTLQTGSGANTLLSPLVTIVMLWLMLRAACASGRLAMLGGAACLVSV